MIQICVSSNDVDLATRLNVAQIESLLNQWKTKRSANAPSSALSKTVCPHVEQMHCFPGFCYSSGLEEVHEIGGEIIHGMKVMNNFYWHFTLGATNNRPLATTLLY